MGTLFVLAFMFIDMLGSIVLQGVTIILLSANHVKQKLIKAKQVLKCFCKEIVHG